MSQVITIDDFTTYMTTTSLSDDMAQQVVDAINQWIESRTHRVWGETKTVTNERYMWQPTIWLRQADITEVTSITAGFPGQTQQTLNINGYYFNPIGRIQFYGSWYGAGSLAQSAYRDYIGITYTYGNSVVPDDLKLAALGVAGGFYNWSINGQRDIAATSVGSYSVQYTNKRMSMGGMADDATSTGDANWAVIESYRMRRS